MGDVNSIDTVAMTLIHLHQVEDIPSNFYHLDLNYRFCTAFPWNFLNQMAEVSTKGVSSGKHLVMGIGPRMVNDHRK